MVPVQWLAEEFHAPIVLTGFEPMDLLEGIAMLVAQLEQGRAEVENQYPRSVGYDENQSAQEIVQRYFMPIMMPRTTSGT